ncbi:uncharacterized protein [Apostichopus japonicus]|uniref:uncharacterized protein isoform X2 n=1 Tax=Stichopus japonicus TaxID=307972 RepID=UPI003AB3D075
MQAHSEQTLYFKSMQGVWKRFKAAVEGTNTVSYQIQLRFHIVADGKKYFVLFLLRTVKMWLGLLSFILVAQISVISARRCFMVNDESQGLRWRLQVTKDKKTPCDCSAITLGGVYSSNVLRDRCKEDTKLFLTHNAMKISSRYDCDVTGTNLSTLKQSVTTPLVQESFSGETENHITTIEGKVSTQGSLTTSSLTSQGHVITTTGVHTEETSTKVAPDPSTMPLESTQVDSSTVKPSTEGSYTSVTPNCTNQYKQSCYTVTNMSLTLPQAEEYCTSLNNNTALVTIQDAGEDGYVTNLLLNTSSPSKGNSYWLGLKRADYRWADGTFLSHDNFWLNAEDGAECFFYDKSLPYLNWNNKDCSELSTIVCEVEQDISTANGFTCITIHDGICYVPVPSQGNFVSALEVCSDEYFGSLLQLETPTEDNGVNSYLTSLGIWLGIVKTKGTTSHVWNDANQSPMTFNKTGSSYGTYFGICTIMDAQNSYSWIDVHCDDSNYVLCETILPIG